VDGKYLELREAKEAAIEIELESKQVKTGSKQIQKLKTRR